MSKENKPIDIRLKLKLKLTLWVSPEHIEVQPLEKLSTKKTEAPVASAAPARDTSPYWLRYADMLYTTENYNRHNANHHKEKESTYHPHGWYFI